MRKLASGGRCKVYTPHTSWLFPSTSDLSGAGWITQQMLHSVFNVGG